VTKDILAARSYAQALFEIAREYNWDEEIEDELVAFSQAFAKSPELSQFISNPHLRVAQKRDFINKLYANHKKPYYPTLLNFFTLLFERNRFHLAGEIAVEFKRIADEFQGQSVVDIHSATALTQQDEQAILQKLEKIAGEKVSVRKVVDPSLVGGVMVRIKNRIIDGTVKHQIEQMKKELIGI
jgi:F-type H+-transporting ATPase subunit delta